MNQTYKYYKERKVFTAIDICIPIVLIVLIILTIFTLSTPTGDIVEIYLDGQLYGSYSLDYNLPIEIKDGENYNVILIKDGAVSMTDASCDNQLCRHHTAISKASQQIICAPNGIVVIVKNSNSKIDGVTGGSL